MSNKNFKNQNRRNYNQYANKEEIAPVEENEVITPSDIDESMIEEAKATEEEVKEKYKTIKEEFKEEVVNPDPKPIYGVVNCAKLNIRRGPSIDTASLCVVEDGSKLDIEQFNEEWLKVLTEDGISGYCMRKFIDEQ